MQTIIKAMREEFRNLVLDVQHALGYTPSVKGASRGRKHKEKKAKHPDHAFLCAALETDPDKGWKRL